MLPLPKATGQLPAPEAVQVQVQPVNDAGKLSVTVTLLIALALGLVTVMVYVVDDPAVSPVTPLVLLIDTSALGAVQPPVGLPGQASQASPSESPSAFCWPKFAVDGQLSLPSQMPSRSVSAVSVPWQTQARPMVVAQRPSSPPNVVPRVIAYWL